MCEGGFVGGVWGAGLQSGEQEWRGVFEGTVGCLGVWELGGGPGAGEVPAKARWREVDGLVCVTAISWGCFERRG